MEKIANIILVVMFIIIALCITIPICFAYGNIPTICVWVGLGALIILSSVTNYLIYCTNDKSDNKKTSSIR